VTGGAGFIGSNIVEHLVGEGHRVTVLDDLSSGYRLNLEPFLSPVPRIRFVEGDVRDEAAVDEAVRGAEAVFHLAASVGNKRSIDHPLIDAEINVLGTLRVLEACRRHGARKVLVSSSAGIFGELKTLPIREDHPIEPDSPYGCTKLCKEKECLAYGKLYDIEATALRYFNVYGARQRFDAYGNVIPIFVFRMLSGEPVTIFGDGEQTRDFVEVRDVVQANLKAALSTGTGGAYNIASGTRITINDLASLLSDRIAPILGRRPEIRHGDPRPGDVRHSLADIDKARRAFGYEPRVALEDGLRDYVAWAAEEYARTRAEGDIRP
jgi:UDP-glucose 4-epimerase